MGNFLAFLGVAFIVIATPGPDTAITIRNSLFGGVIGGVMTALGIASGQLIWAFATSIGIVAVLIASEPLFLAVKYTGAAYLIYLGIQALREAIWPSITTTKATGQAFPDRRLKPLAAYRQGLISDLGNPKMAVFFASLLPQFVPSGGATFSALLFLGVVFSLMTLIWLVLYAAFISKFSDFLRRSSVSRLIEGITGTALLVLGLRVATDHR